jgi:hypothetical protein
MTVWLKQSTAVTVMIGPFIDDTDGKTAETGLTVSQADVRLTKNGANIAQKNESTSCTHDELGHYTCPLDATDTNTLGVLRLMVHESGALPVWQDFMVVPANVWDSFFGADALQVHANEITAGLITAAAIATNAIDADALAADAVTEIQSGLATAAALTVIDDFLDTEVAAILADTNELQTDWVNGGRLDLLIDAILEDTGTTLDDLIDTEVASVLAAVDTEVAAILADTNELQTDWVNGGRLDLILDARASQTSVDTIDDFLDTEVAAILADTNELQTDWVNGGRLDLLIDAILEDTGTTLDDLIDTEVGAIKAVTDKLDTALELDGAVYRYTTNALEQAPTGGSAPTAAAIADAVWDEAATGHTDAGKAGEQLWTDIDAILTDTGTTLETDIDAILADTNELQTDWVNGGRLDLLIDAILEDTGTTLDDLIDTEVGAIKAVTDKLDTALELDGAVYRYTTNALEQAPSGGASAASIADAVWDEALAGHAGAGTAGAALSAAGAGSGSGSSSEVFTINDGVNPLEGAQVWITTDAAGTNIVASGVTDTLGQVTLYLDPGNYYSWVQLSGYNFTNPTAITVT